MAQGRLGLQAPEQAVEQAEATGVAVQHDAFGQGHEFRRGVDRRRKDRLRGRGLDVLVFTGGVGEHSSLVRRRAAVRLAYLGVTIDLQRNDAIDIHRHSIGGHDTGAEDHDISATGATVRTLVITAREDLRIAREAREVLRAQ